MISPESKPFLSIVIPAYNEARRIPSSLESVSRFISSRNFPVEVIVVDDGSSDAMPALLTEAAARWPGLRVLRNESNRGKGYSVRRGFLEARGVFVLLADADLSTQIEEADRLLSELETSQADAAIGSRALRRDLIGVHQPLLREWGGRFFNVLVRALTGLDLRDTQCGFKLFRGETARRAFELQRAQGFGFDPEVLFLIQRSGGKILEVPVHWNDDPDTRVRFARDSARMMGELVALRWRALTGKYDPPGQPRNSAPRERATR
ncbi:MAG: dolichyl-phosphate beta-glucosyltransferase [Terriglobia bacterium]